ncbi:trehalose-phosphatase [Polyangium jinanense]|uniref:Trehalose 6-phosphate phosphatase n=1 Tax=Polyangium jinanense TaxID=2829994 RepID=A0A9X3WZQ7_9BACT|nr:trehalose-phosphatase [Polyangium jinanense]MDC3953156.1 trehalose-phosphatase [Polyangium jinanense]MDC3979723.1 trehalose-phosphatase [Polyangium jinanense]
MDEDVLIARASRAPSLLVATDFDGTIADIVREPDNARGRNDAFAALSKLASMPAVDVAVVSGRDMESLRARTAMLGRIYRIAEHGAFIEEPDGSVIRSVHGVMSHEVIDRVARRAEAMAARVPGMRAERKVRGAALHVREVEPAFRDAAAEVLAAFREIAAAEGLAVMEGRQVVEARDPAASKEDALNQLLWEFSQKTFLIYAGDDTTDEGAIALARQHDGAGIYVASAERPTPNVEADLVLPGPRAWAELLDRIAEARAAVTDRSAP